METKSSKIANSILSTLAKNTTNQDVLPGDLVLVNLVRSNSHQFGIVINADFYPGGHITVLWNTLERYPIPTRLPIYSTYDAFNNALLLVRRMEISTQEKEAYMKLIEKARRSLYEKDS